MSSHKRAQRAQGKRALFPGVLCATIVQMARGLRSTSWAAGERRDRKDSTEFLEPFFYGVLCVLLRLDHAAAALPRCDLCTALRPNRSFSRRLFRREGTQGSQRGQAAIRALGYKAVWGAIRVNHRRAERATSWRKKRQGLREKFPRGPRGNWEIIVHKRKNVLCGLCDLLRLNPCFAALPGSAALCSFAASIGFVVWRCLSRVK